MTRFESVCSDALDYAVNDRGRTARRTLLDGPLGGVSTPYDVLRDLYRPTGSISHTLYDDLSGRLTVLVVAMKQIIVDHYPP